MQVAAGTRLGPYEIVAPLGAGGMGEVYRARDTRLDRDVAVKVLPAEFRTDAQLKIRFEREAKTISQLNHPHICTLFDVGDGYLVMEMLEGESLADRIAKGPLPVEDVLRIGIQIASALGAEVFATSSEQGKLERARQLGAAHAVDYSANAWPAKMRDLCPGGFEAIIDGAGPPLWQALVDLLQPGGTLVTYGLGVGPSAEFASLPLLWQWRKVLGTTMGSPRDFLQLMQHVDESSWRPAIDSVFDMERLPEAAARLGSRDRFGKIALLNR